MEKYIYVVFGQTGEYDDFTDWEVRAFRTRAAADTLCSKLNAWCKERCLDIQGYLNTPPEKREIPEDDPHFFVLSTGTEYLVEELPFTDE